MMVMVVYSVCHVVYDMLVRNMRVGMDVGIGICIGTVVNTKKIAPTYRPFLLNNPGKHSIQLFLVFHPFPTNQRHAYSP